MPEKGKEKRDGCGKGSVGCAPWTPGTNKRRLWEGLRGAPWGALSGPRGPISHQ